MTPLRKQPPRTKLAHQPSTATPTLAGGVTPTHPAKGGRTRGPLVLASTTTVPQAPDLLNLEVLRTLRVDGWVQPVMAEGAVWGRSLRSRNSQSQAQTARAAPAPAVAASASAIAAKRARRTPPGSVGGGAPSAPESSNKAGRRKGRGNTKASGKGRSKPQNSALVEAPDSQPYSAPAPPSATQESVEPVSSGARRVSKGSGKGRQKAKPALTAAFPTEPTLQPARERKRKAAEEEDEIPESRTPHNVPQPAPSGKKRPKTTLPSQAPALAPADPAVAPRERKSKAPAPTLAPISTEALPPALSTRFSANKRGIMFPMHRESGKSSASATAPSAPAVPELPIPQRSTRTRLVARSSPRTVSGPSASRVCRNQPPVAPPSSRAVTNPPASIKRKKGKAKGTGESGAREAPSPLNTINDSLKRKEAPPPPPFNPTEAINTALIASEADLLIEMARNALGREFSGKQPDSRNLAPNAPSGSSVGKRVFGGKAGDHLFRLYRDRRLERVREEPGEGGATRPSGELEGEVLADWVRAGADAIASHSGPDSREYRPGGNEKARLASSTTAAEGRGNESEEEQSPLGLRSRDDGCHSLPEREKSRTPSPPGMSPWKKECFEECIRLG